MTSLTYDAFSETRTYDPLRMQLTRIPTTRLGGSVMDMSYRYTAGQNNGQISQSVDGVSGETVNYTYDALKRLATAQAANNSWGNAYSYDGFGNLTAATVTAGSAPHFSIGANPATNGVPGTPYDANGNPWASVYQYDVENRIINQYDGTGTRTYDPSGKRVAQWDGTNGTRLNFDGIAGQRLGTYTLSSRGAGFSTSSLNLYFGSKLIRSRA